MTTRMKPIDMGKIVKEHRGKWVALMAMFQPTVQNRTLPC
jgi:hypothetical protein